jgi:hypothetical protein
MNENDEFEIPLDAETYARLIWLARTVRKPPGEIAADLLRDLLNDHDFQDAFDDTVSSARH